MNDYSIESQLREKLRVLSDFIKKSDSFSSLELTPKVAAVLNTCRICKKSTTESRQLTLNYGEEFAHTECYEANK